MTESLRYLLLQMRRPDDPMVQQEVRCFARALQCSVDQIEVFDLVHGAPAQARIGRADVVLLGGSGEYSVVKGGPWEEHALDTLRYLYHQEKPTFASCWGFQAFARALGGTVVHDLSRAELGTHRLFLTPEGERDPVFGPIGSPFLAQMGHEDIVDSLPDDAVCLASSPLVQNQAFRFRGRPIYCTQFHSELDKNSLIERVRAYPEYVERVEGIPLETFIERCQDAPDTEDLLIRFVENVFGKEIEAA